MTEQRLIVRVKIIVNATLSLDAIRSLSVVDQSSTPELQAMREVMVTQMGNKYGGASLVLDYPLTMEELRSYGGTVYYSELDCLISTLGRDLAPPHPYSMMGRHEQLVQVQAEQLKGAGFGYSVDIVDSSGRHGDRFINISGKVYKIPAARDTSRRDGIYVVSNAPVTGEYGANTSEVKRYPFEGVEETLGIYRTAEEAAILGDVTLARKRELAELEHEIQRGKSSLLEVKNKHEIEMVDKNKQIERLKAQAEEDKLDIEKLRAREELERQRIKDFYDSRAYSRKDNSEALKMIPSIVVGIGALLMALKALL